MMSPQKQNDGKAITIYDIAKEAGVSAATVSRVLTNNANVRPEKKKKILEIIEKYNFKPNALARGLSDTKRKVIGIIAADVRNQYYAELFVACEIAASKAGYTVLLCNSLAELEEEKLQLEKLEEQRVDAIIQLGGSVDDLETNQEYAKKVNQLLNNMPMIITGKLDGTECYQVQIDAVSCIDLIMEHLLFLNHKKIALVGGRMNVLSTFKKFQRYKEILKKNNIEFKKELIADDSGYNYESGYERMNKMLNDSIIPTAVIAINDFAASGVMKSITEHGYRIPEDISVASYDNTYIASLLTPNLSSIEYNYETFGNQLIETAIAAIEKREIPKLQLIPCSLVVRESTGPATRN